LLAQVHFLDTLTNSWTCIQDSRYEVTTGDGSALVSEPVKALPGFSWTFAIMLDNRAHYTEDSTTSAVEEPSTTQPPASSQPLDTQAVVLLASGCVALLIFIGIVVWCMRPQKKKKKKRKKDNVSKKHKTHMHSRINNSCLDEMFLEAGMAYAHDKSK
jgi:hypothetical protein